MCGRWVLYQVAYRLSSRRIAASDSGTSNAASALLFHRTDEPLDDRDTRGLAESSVAWADASTLTPASVTEGTEHLLLVRDYVFRR